MNNAADKIDSITRTLQAALRLLQVDYPIRVGIGLLLGVIFLGVFDMIFDNLTLFRISMCLAGGPFITMVPLILPGGRSTRESIKQTLDAAELIMERAKFDVWMRQDFYRKALTTIQKNLITSSKERTRDIGIENKIRGVIETELTNE